jgi:hypothetical protein
MISSVAGVAVRPFQIEIAAATLFAAITAGDLPVLAQQKHDYWFVDTASDHTPAAWQQFAAITASDPTTAVYIDAAAQFASVTADLAPALAQQGPDYWYVAGYSTVALYVDAASIVSDGDVKRAWLWMFYSAEEPGFPGANIRVFEEFNCRSRQDRDLQFTQYNRDGKVLASPDPSAWSGAVADSVGEAELEFTCSDAPSRASFGTQLPQGVTPELHAWAMFDFATAKRMREPDGPTTAKAVPDAPR